MEKQQWLMQQEAILARALEMHKLHVEEMATAPKKEQETSQKQHLLIQFLLLMTQRKIEFCMLLLQTYIINANELLENATAAEAAHPSLMDAIYEKFKKQNIIQSLFTDVETFCKEAIPLAEYLYEQVKHTIDSIQQSYKHRITCLLEQVSLATEKRAKLDEEEKNQDASAPVVVQGIDRELLSIYIQMLDKEASMLEMRIAALQDEQTILKNVAVPAITYEHKLDDIVQPLHPQLMSVFKGENELLIMFDTEVMQNESFFTLSVSLQKLKVQKHFLINRNIRQFMSML